MACTTSGDGLDPGCRGLRVTLLAGAVTVVLDDERRHNALTGEMLSGLRHVFTSASTHPDVRVVVVRGAGDRAFASGADIGEQAAQADRIDTGDATSIPAGRPRFMADLLACRRPVVAMIHGWCMGGGLMVALAADIRVAADDAVFSIPATQLGVAYPSDAVATLVDVVGKAAASELMLTGERIDAAEAMRIGLLNHVVPKADLEAATDRLVERLSANAPLAVATAKAQVAHAVATHRPDLDELTALVHQVWQSADAAEGMRSFAEKRPPRFEGR